MIDPLEIRLLGPFEVLLGGRPASVTGSKRHGLLALLALRCGRVLSVDALIEALWGADLPAAPRNALQHHVARLRAALGPESIVASPDGYPASAWYSNKGAMTPGVDAETADGMTLKGTLFGHGGMRMVPRLA